MGAELKPGSPTNGAAGPEAAGLRADRFLAEAIGSLSRSRVKALIAAGQASRDDRPLRDARDGFGRHLRAVGHALLLREARA